MHDVILARDASDVEIDAAGGAQYATRLPFGIAGAQFEFIRGYNWADVRAGSTRLRFVNTHLESQSSLVALRQAQELLQGPASAPGRSVVVVCDCNSDPLDETTKPADPIPTPHSAPYDLVTGPGGFGDEWLRFAPAAAGFTSGLSELVDDPDLSTIDHRIDMVFGHTAAGAPLPVDRGWIVGRDPANRTATGLWPSDHLGVVIRLRP
jgi:endonuclease/exonuclease/phosphatase family metal-dependent hydrolase